MQIIDNINTPLASQEKPIALSIGNFDGVHLGHQHILKQLADTGAKQLVILSFTSHPSEVLQGRRAVPRICSEVHKQKILAKLGITTLYSIPFTQELAAQSPQQFLERLRKVIPFDFLVLGEDARLGKDRAGTPEVIRAIGDEMGFQTTYVDDLILHGERVSSSLIRLLIQQGAIKRASEYLGRPYSIIWGETDQLCLPPRGYYSSQFAGVNATTKISHSGIEVSPTPSPGIEVKFLY